MKAIFTEAASRLKSLSSLMVWLVIYALKHARWQFFKAFLLAGMSLAMQLIIAAIIILSATIIANGEIKILGRVLYVFEQKSFSVLISAALLLFAMMFQAIILYLSAINIRKLGRLVHLHSIKDLLDELDIINALKFYTPKYQNQTFYQGTLQLGIMVETVVRMISPVGLIGIGFLGMLYLDFRLCIIFVLLLMILGPFFIKQAMRVSKVSKDFHAESAANIAIALQKFFNVSQFQNVLTTGVSVADTMSDRNVTSYMDDYDGMVLANDQMSLLFGIGRAFGFLAAVGYIGYAMRDSSFELQKIAPMLLAFYYCANGMMAFVSMSTNLLRFYPQVKMVNRLYTSVNEIKQGNSQTLESENQANVSEAGLAEDKDIIAVVMPAGIERSSINAFKQSLPPLLAGLTPVPSYGSSNIGFISERFLCTGLKVGDVLCAGPESNRAEEWVRTIEIFKALSLTNLESLLIDGPDTVMTNELWETLSGVERNAFRVIPLLVDMANSASMVPYDALAAFDAKTRAVYLSMLPHKNIYLSVINAIPRSIDLALVLHMTAKGELTVHSQEWLEDYTPVKADQNADNGEMTTIQII